MFDLCWYQMRLELLLGDVGKQILLGIQIDRKTIIESSDSRKCVNSNKIMYSTQEKLLIAIKNLC